MNAIAIDAITVSFISALTALAASLIAPFVTMYVAHRQFNATVLSANRQRWIEGLREQIASLVAQLAAAMGLVQDIDDAKRRAFGHDPELLQRVERLILTVAKIRLMLNPHEADHQDLVRTMHNAVNLLRRPGSYDEITAGIEAGIDAIVTKSQAILKHEWIRVKQGR
jgi:hypothetical protein